MKHNQIQKKLRDSACLDKTDAILNTLGNRSMHLFTTDCRKIGVGKNMRT